MPEKCPRLGKDLLGIDKTREPFPSCDNPYSPFFFLVGQNPTTVYLGFQTAVASAEDRTATVQAFRKILSVCVWRIFVQKPCISKLTSRVVIGANSPLFTQSFLTCLTYRMSQKKKLRDYSSFGYSTVLI